MRIRKKTSPNHKGFSFFAKFTISIMKRGGTENERFYKKHGSNGYRAGLCRSMFYDNCGIRLVYSCTI